MDHQGGQAVWLSSLETLYRIDVPTIPVINPIGSGDCLAVGVAFRLSQGDDVPARIEPRRVHEQAAALAITRVA